MAAAETLIGLLDGDDVGVHLGDDSGDPRRVEAAVRADAFMDVVGGDDQLVVAIGLEALVRRGGNNFGRLHRLQPGPEPRLDSIELSETGKQHRVEEGEAALDHAKTLADICDDSDIRTPPSGKACPR